METRAKRVVFLSHCILNENTRYLGGAGRGGCVREVVEQCLAGVEEEHAAFWEEKLKEAGLKVPPRQVGWRSRMLAMLARRFGLPILGVIVGLAATRIDAPMGWLATFIGKVVAMVLCGWGHRLAAGVARHGPNKPLLRREQPGAPRIRPHARRLRASRVDDRYRIGTRYPAQARSAPDPFAG